MAANFRFENVINPAETFAGFLVREAAGWTNGHHAAARRTFAMLPIEFAYNRYRAGDISYEEYRRLHADPDDQMRIARIEQVQRDPRVDASRGVTADADRKKTPPYPKAERRLIGGNKW